MQKQIIGRDATDGASAATEWLTPERLARVEVSSEDPRYPLEGAFRHGPGPGWRAIGPGLQTVRLTFAKPQTLRRIRLIFDEERCQRTQEFVLSWSGNGGLSYREVVRQQYTFSPPATVEEVEDYRVELAGVNILVLQIIPEISGRLLVASMAAFHLA